MWKHWVVRACTPFEPFKDFELARWTWMTLMDNFPDALSAVLMPNHLHIILPSSSPDEVHMRRLAGIMGALSKRIKKKKLWQPIPAPVRIPDDQHLRRQIRYVSLNPCRKNLCPDPLSWYWSTYREVFGATVERQETAEKLARIWGVPLGQFRVRFHAYVSGDPSVDVKGTPAPGAQVPPGLWAEKPVGEILAACAAALRVETIDVQKVGQLRNLFVHMAYRHLWREAALLGEICAISPHGVRKILRKPISAAQIGAADLCLGDSRLRCGTPPSRLFGK